MAVMVACEPLPVSPLVEQCREREQAPQGVLSPQARQIRYVGDIFRDCPNCPEMVVLPAGFFLMGSPPDAAWGPSVSQEQPYHPVTIAEPLAVGRYEVSSYFRSVARNMARPWGKTYIGFRVAREMTVAQILIPLE